MVIDGNSKSLLVERCLETEMRRDLKPLYDVMADTTGYIQVKMRAASFQLARTARDETINSLREDMERRIFSKFVLVK